MPITGEVWQTVYQRMMRRTRDPHLADDLAQDGVARGIRARGLDYWMGATEKHTANYLSRAAAAALTDRKRRAGRERKAIDELRRRQETAIEEVTEESSMEVERAVQQALASLNPKHREAFVLREIGGLSYVDIANHMRKPIATVGSWISRARCKLQIKLQKFLTDNR